MAKIVYGVSGEGSGHSSRARQMLRHLEDNGHQVKVASYDRGWRNLKDDFDVSQIVGLNIVSVDNKVSSLRTLTHNLRKVADGTRSLRQLRQLFGSFKPDCVITDFEPMTGYLAKHYGLPLISLDNQHRLRYMEYPRPSGFTRDALITETVVKAMVPRPSVSLITTFYFGDVKNDSTFLFPPILREEVTQLTTCNDGHILVYVNNEFDDLIELLQRFPREQFKIYGYHGQTDTEHMSFRPFSVEGFLDDLASCKAVVATSGFTLMTESLHLGKPYFAMPIDGQFEQTLNALLLDTLGYGVNCAKRSVDALAAFLYRLDDYRSALSNYDRQGNEKITAKLDELLADDCALLDQYRRKRAAA